MSSLINTSLVFKLKYRLKLFHDKDKSYIFQELWLKQPTNFSATPIQIFFKGLCGVYQNFHLLIFSEDEQMQKGQTRASMSESSNIFDSSPLFPTLNTSHTNAQTSKQKRKTKLQRYVQLTMYSEDIFSHFLISLKRQFTDPFKAPGKRSTGFPVLSEST